MNPYQHFLKLLNLNHFKYRDSNSSPIAKIINNLERNNLQVLTVKPLLYGLPSLMAVYGMYTPATKQILQLLINQNLEAHQDHHHYHRMVAWTPLRDKSQVGHYPHPSHHLCGWTLCLALEQVSYDEA